MDVETDPPSVTGANARGPAQTDPGTLSGDPDCGDVDRLCALPILIGVVGALLIAGLARPNGLDTDPRNMTSWEPTVQQIRQNTPVGPITDGDPRIEEFNRQLTVRYRQRLLAVRVLLRPPDRIEIRCGANISRRLVARIAVLTESDAQALFGRPFDVDVYETYVAAPKRKIAELRHEGPSSRPRLIFDEDRWSEWPQTRDDPEPHEPATRAP